MSHTVRQVFCQLWNFFGSRNILVSAGNISQTYLTGSWPTYLSLRGTSVPSHCSPYHSGIIFIHRLLFFVCFLFGFGGHIWWTSGIIWDVRGQTWFIHMQSQCLNCCMMALASLFTCLRDVCFTSKSVSSNSCFEFNCDSLTEKRNSGRMR